MTTFVIWPFVLVAVSSPLADCCYPSGNHGFLATRYTVVNMTIVTSQWKNGHWSVTLFLEEKGPKSLVSHIVLGGNNLNSWLADDKLYCYMYLWHTPTKSVGNYDAVK